MPADDVVENEADDSPRNVIECSCGWDKGGAVEYDREVDVVENRIWPLYTDGVGNKRCNCSNEEKV